MPAKGWEKVKAFHPFKAMVFRGKPNKYPSLGG